MLFRQPKLQLEKSLDLKSYNNRIIVAGTRHFTDKLMFHNSLIDYLNEFIEPVIFISGAAPSGADRMIIDWCNKFQYPCIEMPADWDHKGRAAGHIRNYEMAQVASFLLAFYDGVSPGTSSMLNMARDLNIPARIINIKL